MMTLSEKFSNLYTQTWRRAWSNYKVRTIILGASIFLTSMSAIYVTTSNRVSYEVRDFKRITPNSITNDRSGLSINGISVDYSTSNGSYLTLDDFVTKEKNTQIVFTWTPKTPASCVTVSFGEDKSDYVSQMTFSNDPLSIKSETKELVFGNKNLSEIVIEADKKTYNLKFKSVDGDLSAGDKSNTGYNGGIKK